MSVLSIQSWTCHGYVGNRVAVFTLQLLGLQVTAINSVHLSNHTGYTSFRGQVLSLQQFRDIIQGLRDNNLLQEIKYVLTGYIANHQLLQEIIQLVKELDVTWICDPVMGDEGKLYVREEVVNVFRKEVLSECDVLTPNHFELETLSNQSITSQQQLFQVLQQMDVGEIWVTSTHILPVEEEGRQRQAMVLKQSGQITVFTYPKLEGYFTGSGDMTAALILARTRLDSTVEEAALNIIATLQHVLSKTVGELQLVKSIGDILQPERAELDLRVYSQFPSASLLES